MNWIYRLVRKHTKPMSVCTAYTWHRRLSFLYVFLAWNALGLVAIDTYLKRREFMLENHDSAEEVINKTFTAGDLKFNFKLKQLDMSKYNTGTKEVPSPEKVIPESDQELY